MRDSLSRFVILLTIGAACATGLWAQSGGAPPPAQEQQPTFRTEAHFVRVDVYPTKGGQPLHGLQAHDFEVFEDGVLQQVEAFEHVVISPAGPQEARIEPNSQRESLQAAANPRNRVFMIFLDTPNVGAEGAHHINEPLIRLLNRILGPDDLVGLMTPAMSASQVLLGRKTQVIEDSLRENWAWGSRFSYMLDEREKAYDLCYPPTIRESEAGQLQSKAAKEMIRRNRERATLEALQDLVRYLHGVREERKAILAVTEGWLLLREDRELMGGVGRHIPGSEPVTVGPTGTLTTRDPRNHYATLTRTECDTDRMKLAMMDNERFLRLIIDEANRANASFYPIDPRGLPVFDSPIGGDPLGPERPRPVHVDQAMLRTRHEALRTLAGATDGLAVLNSNDLDKGLRRIADDLTSYYLLGYYSTNPKLDGGYRRLTVRVKQPGVEVRARRGYRAASEEEVASARDASEAPVSASAAAFTAAMGSLARIRPDAPFRINAVVAPGPGASGVIWVAGELQAGSSRAHFPQGGTADIEAIAGGRSSTTRVMLEPGARTFLATMKLPAGEIGQLDVRARLTGEGVTIPLTEAVQVDAGSAQPLLFRRGPSTGNRAVPAADFRFSRTERLRLELPVGAEVMPGEARVLDKAGQPLQVPVIVGERVDDASGQRWITAEVVLAPLAAGDYAVETGRILGSTEQRVVTGIRVTR